MISPSEYDLTEIPCVPPLPGPDYFWRLKALDMGLMELQLRRKAWPWSREVDDIIFDPANPVWHGSHGIESVLVAVSRQLMRHYEETTRNTTMRERMNPYLGDHPRE